MVSGYKSRILGGQRISKAESMEGFQEASEQHVIRSGKIASEHVEEFLELLEEEGFRRRDAYDPESMASHLPKGWKDHWKVKYAAVFSRPREIRLARPGMAEFLLRVETVVKNLEDRVASSFIFRVLFYVLLYTSVFDALRVTLLTADQLWPFDVLTFDDPVVALFSVLVALPLYIFFFVYRLICPLIVSFTLYKLVRHPESYRH
ncbi:hypothetical protein R1sor_001497 [Riccia sorocarpa]|uniref:Uncharacterized protein n=1 Tax=Riccia sorocarpa TaxID=122646 RepID=A0ABD3GW45_9MARC